MEGNGSLPEILTYPRVLEIMLIFLLNVSDGGAIAFLFASCFMGGGYFIVGKLILRLRKGRAFQVK